MIQNFFDHYLRKSKDTTKRPTSIPNLISTVITNENDKFFQNEGDKEVLKI